MSFMLVVFRFISVWDMATDPEAVNPKEKYAFTALLKKVFLMMVDKRRNDFAAKLFDKYNKDAGVLPCLENFVEHFQSGLTEAMNQLPLDSNVLSNNMELFEKTKDPVTIFHLNLQFSPFFRLFGFFSYLQHTLSNNF